MKLSYLFSVSTAILLMTGCGEDAGTSVENDPATVTGQFIDSAVEGLEYSCSSGLSGVTNKDGEFTCKVGDTVTFSINGFEIGSASAQSVVTPKTLYSSDSAASTNLAQLLQTLDSDNNASNGITIDVDSAEVQALSSSIGITLDQADFDSAITTFIGKTLVNETLANTHLDDSIAEYENETTSPTDSTDSDDDDSEVSEFNTKYLTTNQNVESGEILWANKGVLLGNGHFVQDSSGNIYVHRTGDVNFFDKYDLGTISVNSLGEYRWLNEDLGVGSGSKVYGSKLYSSNKLIDATNGSILSTYDLYPSIWFENGSYMSGAEQTAVVGNGTTTYFTASGDEIWSANYGAPKAIIDNYVLTSEATLNLADGTKFSDVGLNEKYATDIDHRLHGKDIWDGDSDQINVTDVTTGATRVVLNNIDEYYDYVVAEKQNILIYQSRDTNEMVAYNTQTMAELWRLTYDPSKVLHEAIYFNPDQSRFYFTNSTSDLISFNTLTGSLVWNKSEICNEVIGFNNSDGTIYCKSRYVTSLEDYTDNYLVAIKP